MFGDPFIIKLFILGYVYIHLVLLLFIYGYKTKKLKKVVQLVSVILTLFFGLVMYWANENSMLHPTTVILMVLGLGALSYYFISNLLTLAETDTGNVFKRLPGNPKIIGLAVGTTYFVILLRITSNKIFYTEWTLRLILAFVGAVIVYSFVTFCYGEHQKYLKDKYGQE